MGVTFAYKTLGVLNDETILDELDSFKTNEEDAEDLPELRFVPQILLFSLYYAQYRKIHIETSSCTTVI